MQLAIHTQDATPLGSNSLGNADLDEALELHTKIEKRQVQLDEGKAALKLVKNEIKSMQLARDRLLGRVRDGQPSLYDHVPDEPAPTPDGDPTQAWRREWLGDALVGVPKGIIEKLQAANIRTLGELAEWTAADAGRRRLADIPGIGEAAAEKIEAACEAYWERRAGK